MGRSNDPVTWPSHYNQLTTQPIDVINQLGFNFNLGNAMKYLWRCDSKNNKIEDLRKATFYINFELFQMGMGPDPRGEEAPKQEAQEETSKDLLIKFLESGNREMIVREREVSFYVGSNRIIFYFNKDGSLDVR